MQKDSPEKILFVINPVAGGKEKQDWEASIREFFKDLPHSIEIFLLTGKDDTVSIKHHIETLQPQKVVAVGGDGAIKMVAEILGKSQLCWEYCLQVLPMAWQKN